MMHVLLFGASGGTGRELAEHGAAQGHVVTAFVRHPARFPIHHANIKIHQGDVSDRRSVESAMQGQDAAISALGGASLTRREPTFVVGMHNIVSSMELARVRRFVYLSADTVRDARNQFNLLRKIVVPLIFSKTAADHELNEGMVRESHLDWIIVRPPMLTDGKPIGTYRAGEHLKTNAIVPRISRADLADFMLKQLTDDTFLRKTPEVMY
jgi:putative NADH-flavin reductase